MVDVKPSYVVKRKKTFEIQEKVFSKHFPIFAQKHGLVYRTTNDDGDNYKLHYIGILKRKKATFFNRRTEEFRAVIKLSSYEISNVIILDENYLYLNKELELLCDKVNKEIKEELKKFGILC